MRSDRSICRMMVWEKIEILGAGRAVGTAPSKVQTICQTHSGVWFSARRALGVGLARMVRSNLIPL
jgi:hypothetical protein